MTPDGGVSTRVDTPVTRTVRGRGECTGCGAEGPVITDPTALYEGDWCHECVLSGEASDLPLVHERMSAVVVAARGIRGDEPYRTLLRAVDAQRGDPDKARDIVEDYREKVQAAKHAKRLVSRGVLTAARKVVNRRDRRAVAARTRKNKR